MVWGTTGRSPTLAAVEIVGVVGDVMRPWTGRTAPGARSFTSYCSSPFPTHMIVKARSRSTELVPALRRAVASVDLTLPIYDVLTLDHRIAAALARPRLNAALVG